MALKDDVRLRLSKKGKTIPELCEQFRIKDEIEMMRIIAELEIAGEAIIDGKFDKVYREDGGAIYLARYKKVNDKASGLGAST